MARLKVVLVSSLTGFDGRHPEGIGSYEPPIGVLTLISLIRARHTTSFIDLNRIWKKVGGGRKLFLQSVLDDIVSTGADVVGFSSISGSYPTTIHLARLVADEMPDARIVLGGPQASVVDVATLRDFTYIDAVIRGEAEHTFPLWLECLERQEPALALPGVTFRFEGEIRRNPNAPVIEDLDSLPLPAFDLCHDLDQVTSFPLELGRGCPFACTFCSTNDFFRRRFRLKSPAVILQQMRSMHEQYGASAFSLVHDMFTVDRRKVAEFCDALLDQNSPFRWSCSARTDCVDRALLELMQRAGCTGVFFGIETGSQRMQEVIGKNLDLEQSRSILRTADRLGLETTASLITGYPQERIEDLQQTVSFFVEMIALPTLSGQLHILSPLAATPLTTEYADRLALDPDWVSRSANGIEQDEVGQELIRTHPEVFSNFYAFPCQIDGGFLRRARDFFIYAGLRCSGLLQALHRFSGDVLGVFTLWDRTHLYESATAFYGWAFAMDFIDFVEREYGALNDAAIDITSRFYRSLAISSMKNRVAPGEGTESALFLQAGVHVITLQGDIVHVLESLRNGVAPNPALVQRVVTVVVQQSGDDHGTISEMSPLATDLIRFAESNRTITEVVEDFEQRNICIGNAVPAAVAIGAIEMLQSDGLIRCPLLEQA